MQCCKIIILVVIYGLWLHRLSAPPDPLAAIKGALLLRGGRGEKERKGGGGKGKERGRERRGEGREGREGMWSLTLSPGSASGIVQSGPEKNASLMHRYFAKFAAESCCFHQNAQKLTANTKNGQILKAVIKYFLFDSWQRNYLKSINTATFSRPSWVVTENKMLSYRRETAQQGEL